MKIQRVFDLTENEHSINHDMLCAVCERLGATLTYERLQPHVPMKRLATFEFKDTMMWITFLGLFDSVEHKP